MSEAKVDLVNPQAFTINFPSLGENVTVRTESDEIVILMRLTLRPRDNVMDFGIDVTTSGDGAPVAGLDKNSAFDIRRYGVPIPGRHDE